VINERKLNGISIAVGLLLTAYVAQNLHFNPRWYGDKGPGVGKLPREVVAGYMDVAYGQGKPTEAEKLYYTPKTIDLTPKAVYRAASTGVHFTVRQVIAEGLNVAVHHCVDAYGDLPAHEVVDMFRTANGRIVWRKTIAQALNGESCTTSSMGKRVDLGLK
jgi:hypothetical protein